MGAITFNIISGTPPFTAILTPLIGAPYIQNGLPLGYNYFTGIPDGDNYTLTITDSRGCTYIIYDIDINTLECSPTGIFQYAHSSIVVNNVLIIGERKANPNIVMFTDPDNLAANTIVNIPGIGTAGQGLESVCYSDITGKLYFGARDNGTGYLAIIEFDVNTLVYSKNVIIGLTADLFVITTDGEYIYGGTDEKFFKIRISDWSIIQTENFVGSGFADSHGAAISPSRDLFYVSSQYGVSMLAIVSMSDLSSYTLIDLSAHVSHPTDDMCVYDNNTTCKVYIAGEWSFVGNGAASVEITNGNAVEGIELSPSYGLWNYCTKIYSAGIDEKIEVFDVSDPSTVTTYTFDEAGFVPNEILFVGNRMFVTKWGALGVAKLCEYPCIYIDCATTTTTTTVCEIIYEIVEVTCDDSTTTTTSTTCGIGCYGLLYNWYTVIDPRNLAPAGWRVANYPDYWTLMTYLDPDGTTNPEENGNNAGGYLKETGFIHWDSPNIGATNSTGFNGVAGGIRATDGQFYEMNTFLNLWNTDNWMSNDWGLMSVLLHDTDYFRTTRETPSWHIYSYSSVGGASIRLIKDDDVDPGTLVGNDGYVYTTVKIGNQVWINENLRETKYRNGDCIPVVEDATEWINQTSGALCAYNNCWQHACMERVECTTTTTTTIP